MKFASGGTTLLFDFGCLPPALPDARTMSILGCIAGNNNNTVKRLVQPAIGKDKVVGIGIANSFGSVAAILT